MKLIYILSCALMLVTLNNCASKKAAFKGTPIPKANTLNGSGLTTIQLDSLSDVLKNNYATTGMIILYNGNIVYEYGDIQEISYIASCRKSVLSMLYGKHVDNKTIDLNETIGNIGIDEDDGLLEIEKQAKVDHIITSRSGVFHIPANGGYDERNILRRGTVKPGSYFVYNNWDFNVAGYILEQKTNKSVYEEIESQLAIPLGFEDWNIKNQKRKVNEKKSRYSAYHMYFSTRDMAKIGQLMLNEGSWNGQQLIPANWIKKITSPVTSVDTVNQRNGLNRDSPFQLSYGYMWWLFSNFKNHPDFKGAYSASGYGGQFITVIPERNMVIAHKSKLPTLVRWGLRPGGVSNWGYWELIYRLIAHEELK